MQAVDTQSAILLCSLSSICLLSVCSVSHPWVVDGKIGRDGKCYTRHCLFVSPCTATRSEIRHASHAGLGACSEACFSSSS